MILKQNWVADFFSFSKHITVISQHYKANSSFCVCFTKINNKIFLWWTKASINCKIWTSTYHYKIILAIVSMIWRTIINIKNYIICSTIIMKTPKTCTIKCYSNKSSSAAELGQGSKFCSWWWFIRVETCTDPCGPNRSHEAARSAADDDWSDVILQSRYTFFVTICCYTSRSK